MDLKPAKNRLPVLVAALGISLSTWVSYTLIDKADDYLEVLTEIQHHLPWVALIIGIIISILIAMVIRSTHLAIQRANTLKITNKNLRKEINERLQLEESKQKLEVALLQGQKLQAMGTLASGIAHDFNNILYAILGYTELVQQDVAKDSQTYANLGKIIDASKRGKDLVSRILAFSRRQHHEQNEINLNSTIEAALSLLRPTIPASVSIDYRADSDPAVYANQTQIHQVLVNLINNAVDAMDGEGTIDIHTSDIPAHDPFLLQFPVAPDKPYCRIEISDTGQGMNQHTLERMFEPFYTTKEVGKGTGLGLSIVHSIIKEHQGDISVQSQLGKGTTFVLILPIKQVPQGE